MLSVTLIIDEVNRPPMIDPLPLQVIREADTLRFTVTGSDPDVESAVVFSSQNLPAGASFDTSTQAFTWTPDYTQAGEYQVLFAISDGQYRDGMTVHIQVLNKNRPPQIVPVPPLTVAVGSTAGLALTVSDPDGDSVACTIQGMPENGTFDSATRWLAWTPKAAGTTTATARCCDKPGFVESPSLCTEAPIQLTSIGVENAGPTVEARGPYAILEGDTVTFNVGTVDPDGEKIGCKISPMPAGAKYDDVSRTFSWFANYGQAGAYTLHVQCADPHASAATDVRVTITAGTYDRLGGGIATNGCGSTGTPGAAAFLLLLAAIWRRRQLSRRSLC